jgi:predicted CXXCH cytochrome family protein
MLGLWVIPALAAPSAHAQAATPTSVYDEGPSTPRTPTPIPTLAPLSSEECLKCHTEPDQILDLPSGEQLYLTIDGDAFKASRHGINDKQAVGCTDCHTNITAYPHPPLKQQNLRQIAADFSVNCATCHEEQAIKQYDSIHQQLRDEGNTDAAVCADCHNPHYTSIPGQPRTKIVTTCTRCHSGIAQDYRQSVHGAALTTKDNPDVPSCIDCHGVHSIPDPRTAAFLLKSPQLCASCHTDTEKMAPYKLNTNVLNTYVADFHGTTVTLFEPETLDQLPNKPLCIDCHGIHNIKAPDDANSSVMKENLITTCQKCHPNASANFSNAWLSHYTPSPEHNPLVYYVGLFYQIFVPAVLGGMAVFVATDIGRRVVRRFKPAAKGSAK